MVIVATKRKGKDMWEGYTEIQADEAKAYISSSRAMGRICKKFKDINDYRADVQKILDKLGY